MYNNVWSVHFFYITGLMHLYYCFWFCFLWDIFEYKYVCLYIYMWFLCFFLGSPDFMLVLSYCICSFFFLFYFIMSLRQRFYN